MSRIEELMAQAEGDLAEAIATIKDAREVVTEDPDFALDVIGHHALVLLALAASNLSRASIDLQIASDKVCEHHRP